MDASAARGGSSPTRLVGGVGGGLLLEVLVALGILGVGLTATYAVVLRAHQGMVRAEEVSRAVPQVLWVLEGGPEGGSALPDPLHPPEEGGGLRWQWEGTGLWIRHRESGPARGFQQRLRVPWLPPLGETR